MPCNSHFTALLALEWQPLKECTSHASEWIGRVKTAATNYQHNIFPNQLTTR